MYEAFFGLRERPFDLTPNPRFLLLTEQAPRGAEQPAVRAVEPPRPHAARRRGRHRQDHARPHGRRRSRGQGRAHRVSEQPDAEPRTSSASSWRAAYATVACRRAPSKTALLEELSRVLCRTARGRPVDWPGHRRGAEPAARAARRSAAARQHRDGNRKAAAARAGRAAGAGRAVEPAVAAAAEAARGASLPARFRSMRRETAEYIAARIRIAGGNSALVFTRQAVDCIFEHSRGIPRLDQRAVRQRDDLRASPPIAGRSIARSSRTCAAISISTASTRRSPTTATAPYSCPSRRRPRSPFRSRSRCPNRRNRRQRRKPDVKRAAGPVRALQGPAPVLAVLMSR